MRTACEEAADQLYQGSDLCKRLRAEGRELKRLRRMIVFVCAHMNYVPPDVEREATRIQKARKK